jgi:hypothetical protein
MKKGVKMPKDLSHLVVKEEKHMGLYCLLCGSHASHFGEVETPKRKEMLIAINCHAQLLEAATLAMVTIRKNGDLSDALVNAHNALDKIIEKVEGEIKC